MAEITGLTINKSAYKKLMKDPRIQAELNKQAERIAKDASSMVPDDILDGTGIRPRYDGTPPFEAFEMERWKDTAGAGVATATHEGRLANMKDNVLLKAMG